MSDECIFLHASGQKIYCPLPAKNVEQREALETAKAVIQALRTDRVQLICCEWCGEEFTDLEAAKEHIKTCWKNPTAQSLYRIHKALGRDGYHMDVPEMVEQIIALRAVPDTRPICTWCRQTFETEDELQKHVLNCEKNPLVPELRRCHQARATGKGLARSVVQSARDRLNNILGDYFGDAN
jgi:hypothetical protein